MTPCRKIRQTHLLLLSPTPTCGKRRIIGYNICSDTATTGNGTGLKVKYDVLGLHSISTNKKVYAYFIWSVQELEKLHIVCQKKGNQLEKEKEKELEKQED